MLLNHRSANKADAGGLVGCIGKGTELLRAKHSSFRQGKCSFCCRQTSSGRYRHGWCKCEYWWPERHEGAASACSILVLLRWCYVNRPEIACTDAFSSSLLACVQMLFQLYYFYEKSPKYRELEQQVYDMAKGGDKPICSCGTRWMVYKCNALYCIIDCYSVYIAHLSILAQDTSLKATDRARLTGLSGNSRKYWLFAVCTLELSSQCLS